MRLFFLGAFLPLVVTGCATTPTKQAIGNIEAVVESSELRSDSADAVEGLAFAQARCAGCHNVTDGQVSPNPNGLRDNSLAKSPARAP